MPRYELIPRPGREGRGMVAEGIQRSPRACKARSGRFPRPVRGRDSRVGRNAALGMERNRRLHGPPPTPCRNPRARGVARIAGRPRRGLRQLGPDDRDCGGARPTRRSRPARSSMPSGSCERAIPAGWALAHCAYARALVGLHAAAALDAAQRAASKPKRPRPRRCPIGCP